MNLVVVSKSVQGWLMNVLMQKVLSTKAFLNSVGVGIVDDHFSGPLALAMSVLYDGVVKLYAKLVDRQNYPLKIT